MCSYQFQWEMMRNECIRVANFLTSYMRLNAPLLQMEGNHIETRNKEHQDSICQHLHHALHSPLSTKIEHNINNPKWNTLWYGFCSQKIYTHLWRKVIQCSAHCLPAVKSMNCPTKICNLEFPLRKKFNKINMISSILQNWKHNRYGTPTKQQTDHIAHLCPDEKVLRLYISVYHMFSVTVNKRPS